MSRDSLNAGSYNHEPYSRSAGWLPTTLPNSQPSQPTRTPPLSAVGVSANPYGFAAPFPQTDNTYGMTMSTVVDDRPYFQGTPGPPISPYSPFGSSEGSSETRPSTGMDSDYRERSVTSSSTITTVPHGSLSNLRTEFGSLMHNTAAVDRHHSVRDVRKRAYDHVVRLEGVARKAGEDSEANLSIIAFAARPDTKDHSNNTPRFYASPSILEAFRKRGIIDLKAYLTSIAYDSKSQDEPISPELVVDLRTEISALKERLSMRQMDVARLESDRSRLTEENESLRRFAEGHNVVASKLQEVMQLTYDYSMGYAVHTNLNSVP